MALQGQITGKMKFIGLLRCTLFAASGNVPALGWNKVFGVTDTWLVLKFGGTSVSGRPQWETIASLAGQRIDDGNRVLLVCSAVLLASRVEAKHVEIWTDVPGLFSADPRVIPGARLLQALNYQEALEMSASGAKVVHSRCIRAAADANIPVLVRDLGRPGFSGTTIRCDDESGPKGMEGIRSVCCQPQMAVMLLQNLDTREHVGFLAWVFAQISEAGISVDLVATSETTTTIALNRVSNQIDDAMLGDLAERLRERCVVTVYPNCSGINLVGRGARIALKDIDSESGFFAEHPLLMLSQSANDLCISILLHSQDAEELLGILHRVLIEEGRDSEHEAGIFGPVWRDIQN